MILHPAVAQSKFKQDARSLQNYMKKKLLLCLTTISLAVASAATQELTLSQKVWAGSNELKPGTYKVAVEGDKITFTKGKTVVEAPVTASTTEKKNKLTTYTSVDSKIKELFIGGTTTKVVFGETAPAAGTK
jgi:hypothetical protein